MTIAMTIVILCYNEHLQGAVQMQTMKASEFKAKCLHLMDMVNSTGEEVIITKNGRPVSKLVPYRVKPESLFGLHQGDVLLHDDLIEDVGEKWEAE